MRYRSRSRHYDDSSDRYKGHESSSRTHHKSKETHSHYSSENRKYKKTSEKSRYDNHHHDSESDDKVAKRRDTSYDKDTMKKSKYDTGHEKRSRKHGDYTHSYRRNSVSSDLSNDSYRYRQHRSDDKSSDRKKSYYRDRKRSKVSRSASSDDRVKREEEGKEKKDKKVKKKSKKVDKDNKLEKKKKKKQKHLSPPLLEEEEVKKLKESSKKSVIKTEPVEEIGKVEIKLEPFKVKETSLVKNQLSVLNKSNIFTKDEWQKEDSDEEVVRKGKGKHSGKEGVALDLKKKGTAGSAKETGGEKGKSESALPIPQRPLSRTRHTDNRVVEVTEIKEEETVKKIKDNKEEAVEEVEEESSRRKTVKKSSKSEKVVHKEEKSVKVSRGEHHNNHHHGSSSREVKKRGRERHERQQRKRSDTEVEGDLSSEEERLELPRTPTDAQFAGVFTRLQEEGVSETDMEDILPPMLLDDRMSALLLENVCGGAQEAWDSEDDVLLLSRREGGAVGGPRHRGVLETLAVPWKMLIGEAALSSKVLLVYPSEDGLCKYQTRNLLSSVSVSYKLAGEELWNRINNQYPSLLLNPIPAIHQCLSAQQSRRKTIFRERVPLAGALSARKDFFIRKVLLEPTV